MRMLTNFLHERLINCRRAFNSYPSKLSDYGWTKASVEELRAEAEEVPQPLTHLDKTGAAHMVEITGKAETKRVATAVATLYFSNGKTYDALSSQQVVKGNAIAVARLAAIQAAKKTSDLVPLAHPSLGITAVSVDVDVFGHYGRNGRKQVIQEIRGPLTIPALELTNGGVTITATVKCEGKTGVEMEAITAATIGAVTMYDMLKAIDKGMVIMGARVIRKEGGKSGGWEWDESKHKLVKTSASKPKDVSEQPSQPIGIPHATESSETRENGRQPMVSDIDEWNQGLVDEFSMPEVPQSAMSERREAEDSINISQRFGSLASQTDSILAEDEGQSSSYDGSNHPRTEDIIPGEGKEAHKKSQLTTQLSSDSSNLAKSPLPKPRKSPTRLAPKFPSKPNNDPSAAYDPENPFPDNTIETTKLVSHLREIQKSPYIERVAGAHEPNHRELELDTRKEWVPSTMSPIRREDLTKHFKAVDSRDMAEWRRKRYEESGGPARGSVIE